MKKTMLLLLVLCSIGYNAFAQKKQKRSFTIDTVYFGNISLDSLKSNTKSIFGFNRNVSVDSIFFRSRMHNTGLFSREETNFSLTRKVQLSNNSGSKSIAVNVTDNTPQFLLSIQCNLDSGVVEVEILDPEGLIKGRFSVDNEIKKTESGWTQQVEGSIDKRIINPEEGEWTITFKTKKATGVIQINSNIN